MDISLTGFFSSTALVRDPEILNGGKNQSLDFEGKFEKTSKMVPVCPRHQI